MPTILRCRTVVLHLPPRPLKNAISFPPNAMRMTAILSRTVFFISLASVHSSWTVKSHLNRNELDDNNNHKHPFCPRFHLQKKPPSHNNNIRPLRSTLSPANKKKQNKDVSQRPAINPPVIVEGKDRRFKPHNKMTGVGELSTQYFEPSGPLGRCLDSQTIAQSNHNQKNKEAGSFSPTTLIY